MQVAWREIHNRLKSDIRENRLPPGTPLPTQAQLAQEFGASRHAVRRAMRALTDAGLVASWQGKGCYVRAKRIDHKMKEHTGLRADAVDQGYDLQVEPLRVLDGPCRAGCERIAWLAGR